MQTLKETNRRDSSSSDCSTSEETPKLSCIFFSLSSTKEEKRQQIKRRQKQLLLHTQYKGKETGDSREGPRYIFLICMAVILYYAVLLFLAFRVEGFCV